ncbi:RidA family protein [Rhizorhabdus wittichii]|uniref:RidA family protein n=1 Tax=Rhizorhabdus wittichii TaxID=160791 RepID=UPI0002E4A392|nr:RidA family protein [Rhizorhabdus wittichii]
MNNTRFLRPDWQWDRDYPLSQMVACGDFLYLSGQVPLDAAGNLVGPGDLRAQSAQVFRNMREVLQLAGCDLRAVIRLTTYFTVSLSDGAATKAYWEVRREYFGDHKPASTGMRVSELISPEMMLEVDAVAYLPAARK